VNLRFVFRGLLLAIPFALLVCAVWIFFQTPFGRPLDPTPPPPTIHLPPDTMPTGPAGLQEWALYQDQAYQQVGSGFLFMLADGKVVGATSAHSVSFRNPEQPLERIALGIAGLAGFVGEFDTLIGQPGEPLRPDNLALDYLLLKVDPPVKHNMVLSPDPRGAPQPGERVSVYSGVDHAGQENRTFAGTVQSVDDKSVWVLMDEWFNPGQMSGSPLVSQHTGKVVGMAVAASPRRNRLLLGAHPIGSLVQLAESATEFPRMVDLVQRAD
jgi:hypothetical protein